MASVQAPVATVVTSDVSEAPPALRPLTELSPGELGRLQATDLAEADRQLLGALGLVDQSRFRLCKAGNPWIVQVRGTRIGLAEAVAQRLKVLVDA